MTSTIKTIVGTEKVSWALKWEKSRCPGFQLVKKCPHGDKPRGKPVVPTNVVVKEKPKKIIPEEIKKVMVVTKKCRTGEWGCEQRYPEKKKKKKKMLGGQLKGEKNEWKLQSEWKKKKVGREGGRKRERSKAYEELVDGKPGNKLRGVL